jgi:hypothetical protein
MIVFSDSTIGKTAQKFLRPSTSSAQPIIIKDYMMLSTLFADYLSVFGFLISWHWVTNDLSKAANNSFCTAQSILILIGDKSSCFWAATVAVTNTISIFSVQTIDWRAPKYFWSFMALNYGFSILITLVLYLQATPEKGALFADAGVGSK